VEYRTGVEVVDAARPTGLSTDRSRAGSGPGNRGSLDGMTIGLQHDSFDTVLSDVRRALADLSEARAQAVRDVAALLDGGWSGRAASSFGQGWSDWSQAAVHVESALSGLADGMSVARSGLVAADDTGGEAMARLAGRLG